MRFVSDCSQVSQAVDTALIIRLYSYSNKLILIWG